VASGVTMTTVAVPTEPQKSVATVIYNTTDRDPGYWPSLGWKEVCGDGERYLILRMATVAVPTEPQKSVPTGIYNTTDGDPDRAGGAPEVLRDGEF
jgi:hypothetical protein